jgi:Family of unknown function (DUF5681)
MRKPRKVTADNDESDDYDVGYGRPPVRHRFKPGQSGNPKGRPKGRKKMGTLLEAVLSERVSIREGDKVRRVPRAEAMVRMLVMKATKGDAKAFATLITLSQQSGEFEKDPPPITCIRRIIVEPDGTQTEY